MPIQRTNRTSSTSYTARGCRAGPDRDVQQDQKGNREGQRRGSGVEPVAAARVDEEEAILVSLYRRPFTVLGHGSLQSQLRCEACCAMQRARNREPRLIKRRRAIVNDTPRLVVKDRGISKRVTAVTPRDRSIETAFGGRREAGLPRVIRNARECVRAR